MLFREQGGGHQDGHLLAICNCDECSAQGNFCFAKTDITANQPVHGFARHQILNGCVDRSQLISRLLEAKSLRECLIGLGIKGKGMAIPGGAACIEVQQFSCSITGLGGCFASRFFPLP